MDEKPICNGCSKPIDTRRDYLMVKGAKKKEPNTYVCPECMTTMESVMEEETRNPNMPMAFAVGLGSAVVTGLGWYFLVTLTGWQVGFVAVLMGWLVGRGVVWGAGHKRGKNLQILSVALTLVAIVLSEFLIFNHFFHEEGFTGNLPFGLFLEAYAAYFTEGKGFLDIIFFGIAVWQAYKTPAARKLQGEIVRAAEFAS